MTEIYRWALYIYRFGLYLHNSLCRSIHSHRICFFWTVVFQITSYQMGLLNSLKKIFLTTATVFFILLFTYEDSNAQMRQVYLDNVEPDNEIFKLSFYSASEGYVGFRDWIGFTTDSGRTFTKKYITLGNVNYNGYSVNLTFGFAINGVKAFTQNTILAFGHYGLVPAILRSTDGGNNYTLIYHSQYNPLQLRTGITDMIFPQNNTTGYAVDADRVLKTTDGGLSWTSVRNDPGSYFTNLEAVDNNNVFALSTEYTTNKLIKTTNGGTNWQAVSLPVLPDGKMTYAHFLTATTGWLSMDADLSLGYFYKTTNGGSSWILQNNATATSFACGKMKFIDNNTGYALSGQNTVWKTFNSGVTWEPLPRDNSFTYLGYTHNDLQCLSVDQLWAGGGHGLLELSTNGGGTPIPQAYFLVDTIGVGATGNVNLVNYSRTGYTYQWLVNGSQVSTSYNATYAHDISLTRDTIKLIVSNGTTNDTTIQYQDFYPPVIVGSFTPTSAGTGNQVMITGVNFSGATSVSFGGVAASFTVLSSTSIRAFVGAGASGAVKVSAYELNRKGYEVQVLEASHRAGGRNLTLRGGDLVDEVGQPQTCRFDRGSGPVLQRRARAHSRPSHRFAGLLQRARRGTRAFHQRQPQRLGAGRRDVRRQADPQSRIHHRHARFHRRAAGEIAEARADAPRRSPAPTTQQLLEYVRQFGELDERFRYIGSARAGFVTHDYTMPNSSRSRSTRSELLRSGFMYLMSFGEGGRPVRDDDGAGRRHGPHRRRIHGEGRRLVRTHSPGRIGAAAQERRRRRLSPERQAHGGAGGLLPELHSDAAAGRHREQLSGASTPAASPRFSAASCSRSACR